MKNKPHKKRQLVTRAMSLIARRRAKWLATQRGESVSKQDIAAGRQFAQGFMKAVISDPFWMASVADMAQALTAFVKLAEPQGAPPPAHSRDPKCKVDIDPKKVEIVRAGLMALAKRLGSKKEARKTFIREKIPVRAPGSRTFIVGWVGKEGSDSVCKFWNAPIKVIQQRVDKAVESGKNTKGNKENAVNGAAIEAPPRKKVYEPGDFLPTADDMIGLSHNVSIMGGHPRGKRRAISKKRYEAMVNRLACRLAIQRQCKPSPKEFAAAKKRVDMKLRRKGIAIAGAMQLGVSDIMAASFVLGAAASGSQAAKLAIMKSVEAAKEGSLRAKKDVTALKEAKKLRAAQGKGKPAPKGNAKGKKPLPKKIAVVAKKAAAKAAINAKKKGASKPQAVQAAKAAAAKVVKKAAVQKAKRLGPPHTLPPKRVADARKAIRSAMTKRPPKSKAEAVKRARLLRSFYGSPYPAHPAFKIHDI